MKINWVILSLSAIFMSCKDKIICPAFQSAFILSDSMRTAYFSNSWRLDEQTREAYFTSLSKSGASIKESENPIKDTDFLYASENSTSLSSRDLSTLSKYFAFVEEYDPPQIHVNKNKYGIIKKSPYFVKNWKLRTAPMEDVLAPNVKKDINIDEGKFTTSDFTVTNDSIEGDPLDSLMISRNNSILSQKDTVTVPRSLSEKEDKEDYRFRYDPNDNFNVEQEYYNKYFGDLLLDHKKNKIPVDSTTLVIRKNNIFDSLGIKIKRLLKFGKNDKDLSNPQAPLPNLDSLDIGNVQDEGF